MRVSVPIHGVAVAVLLSFLSAVTWADETSRSDLEAKKNEVRGLLERANRAFKAAGYDEAARLFLETHALIEAYALGSKPELLYNAGLSFERIDACDRVAELFGRYLDRKPEAATPDLKFRLEKARECAPEVTVQTDPAGAVVAIDGVVRGKTPAKVNLKTGTHTLLVTLEGHKPHEKSFSVEPRRPISFAQKLDPIVTVARIALDLPSGAALFLDDEPFANGPVRGVRDIAPGPHRIRFEKQDCVTKVLQIDVGRGGDPVPIDAALECADKTALAATAPTPVAVEEAGVSPWVWGAGSVGAAALAGTAVLAVLSNGAARRRDTERAKGFGAANDEIVRDEQQSALNLAIGAHLTLALAAVSLAGAGAMLILDGHGEHSDPGSSSEPKVEVRAAFGPSCARLALEW